MGDGYTRIVDGRSVPVAGEWAIGKHLRGRRFLGVDRYPSLTFSGVGARPADADRWGLPGALTGRDVMLPLELAVRFLGAVRHPSTPEADLSLDRGA